MTRAACDSPLRCATRNDRPSLAVCGDTAQLRCEPTDRERPHPLVFGRVNFAIPVEVSPTCSPARWLTVTTRNRCGSRRLVEPRGCFARPPLHIAACRNGPDRARKPVTRPVPVPRSSPHRAGMSTKVVSRTRGAGAPNLAILTRRPARLKPFRPAPRPPAPVSCRLNLARAAFDL